MSEHACITVALMVSYGFVWRHVQKRRGVSSVPRSLTPFRKQAWGCGSPGRDCRRLEADTDTEAFPRSGESNQAKISRDWTKVTERERVSSVVKWRGEETKDTFLLLTFLTFNTRALLKSSHQWRKSWFIFHNGASDSGASANRSYLLKWAAHTSQNPLLHVASGHFFSWHWYSRGNPQQPGDVLSHTHLGKQSWSQCLGVFF